MHAKSENIQQRTHSYSDLTKKRSLAASGIQSSEFSAKALRAAIDKIDDKELKRLFLKNFAACEKLISAKMATLQELCQFDIYYPYALRVLLENVDGAIYLIKNRHLTFKRMKEFGKYPTALHSLLKNCVAYASYVERGLTTFEDFASIMHLKLFGYFGEYYKNIDTLMEAGIPFYDIHWFGMRDIYKFEIALKNIDVVIHLIKNRKITLKQICDFGMKDQQLWTLDILYYYQDSISYVKSLCSLVRNAWPYKSEALDALGGYNKAIEKLPQSELLSSLYHFDMSDKLENLLKNGFCKHQTFHKPPFPMINWPADRRLEQCSAFSPEFDNLHHTDKKRLCTNNASLLLEFTYDKNLIISHGFNIGLRKDLLTKCQDTKNSKVFIELIKDVNKMVKILLDVEREARSR